jgi:hypothetical protein
MLEHAFKRILKLNMKDSDIAFTLHMLLGDKDTLLCDEKQ